MASSSLCLGSAVAYAPGFYQFSMIFLRICLDFVFQGLIIKILTKAISGFFAGPLKNFQVRARGQEFGIRFVKCAPLSANIGGFGDVYLQSR